MFVLVMVPYLEIVWFPTVRVIFFTSDVTVAIASFPFAVFAVIVALPIAFAVTLPELSTLIILELLLDHVTLLLVALLGVILAVRVSEFPIINPKEFLFNEISVTSTFWFSGVGVVVGCSFWFPSDGFEVVLFLLVSFLFSSTFSHIAFRVMFSSIMASVLNCSPFSYTHSLKL